MTPFAKPCSRQYSAVHHGPSRPVSSIKWIIIHCTQGDTAEGAAAWFANPASGGSTHLVVDGEECFRTLGDAIVPHGAKGANRYGFHIEIAGWAHWSAPKWMLERRRLQRAAYKAALRCKWYSIPTVWLTPADLQAGKKGISSHANCSAAFGGDHSDPGRGFPRIYFMYLVRRYLKEIR